jgi:hypothetical protein
MKEGERAISGEERNKERLNLPSGRELLGMYLFIK